MCVCVCGLFYLWFIYEDIIIFLILIKMSDFLSYPSNIGIVDWHIPSWLDIESKPCESVSTSLDAVDAKEAVQMRFSQGKRARRDGLQRCQAQ